MKHTKLILPTIVFSQFCCTSLWFAGNGVMDDLMKTFKLNASALGNLTSAVQFGFILGTLIFAIFAISDRFSPSKVFLTCATIAAIFNGGTLWENNNLLSILSLRFFTGFFLAGIYPVGMKIAADHFEKGLGKSLGFLVGALVIGTALPHLAKEMTDTLLWKTVIILTSLLSIIGGLCMFFLVPDGPYRKQGNQIKFSAFLKIFRDKHFRSAAFGYFGHMWELYAFWAFVPFILKKYVSQHSGMTLNIPLWSFLIIGIGGPACVLSGYLAEAFGTKKIAFIALLLSGVCCLISPIIFETASIYLFVTFLLIWGMFVIADSPLFSTLVAQNAAPEIKGTALTIVNSIGFATTIISIQLLNYMQESINPIYLFLPLAIGPLLGLSALAQKQ